MMKKKYDTPAYELILIDDEDIITASYPYDGGEIDVGVNTGDDIDLPFVQ